MAILWFATSRMTEMVDLPFKFMRTGDVPNAAGSTDRRSLFFKPQSDDSTMWASFVADYDLAGDGPRAGLLQIGSVDLPTIGTLEDYLATTDSTGGNVFTVHPNSRDMVGCAMYLLKTNPVTSPTDYSGSLFERFNEATLRAEYAASAQHGNASLFVQTAHPEALNGLVGVAPIKFQWTGSNFGYDPGNGADLRDFFKSKQISGMRAYIRTSWYDPTILGALTSSGAHPTIAFQLFRDTEDSPLYQAVPIHRDGTLTNALVPDGDRDRMDGASFGQGVLGTGKKHGIAYASMSPSVMCVWPQVTINLLALSAKGKILDSDRRYV